MTVAIETTRARVVDEALSWLGTPYRLGAMVKGQGCDCGTLLLGIYRACGLVDGEHLGIYSHDWWLHVSHETYLLHVMRHAGKVAERVFYRSDSVEPGNIALCRAAGSRVYNHGGIVIAWPQVVHALYEGVQEADATRHPLWSYHEIAVFDPWMKKC
ncbi:MAG TPA: hydrolase [Terriglobia bacterium]|nr:hydrolase [Terriglobia bacterium]